MKMRKVRRFDRRSSRPMAGPVTMDKIVALCKRRGLIFPASEIYGGIANTYDYGHYGVLLKNNVTAPGGRAMIQERDDIVALDSAIIQHPRTWEASGPSGRLQRPARRVPRLQAALPRRPPPGGARRHRRAPGHPLRPRPSKLPGDHQDCELTEAREFNLMFETQIGPVKDAGSTVYLRPETAQGIFLDFKTTLQYARKKPPFGIAQIGKSFRNEITPGNFIFRTLEFEQMEMEFFVPPAEAEQWHELLDGAAHGLVRVARHRPRRRCGCAPHDEDELSHYSSATSDIEYLYPIGWSELEGIANRGDFDLTQHAEYSGQKLEYVDTASGERYVPHVIEPAARRGPHRARAPLRRLRRGRHRRRAAHGAPPGARTWRR